MPGSLLLGIDIGTYSSKGVLCTPEGDVLASHVVEHGLSLPHPGWAEHDADGIWWSDLVQISRILLSGRYSGGDVGGVAVSGIGPCLLPVDAQGRPLRPAILYGIDARAQEEIEWLNQRYGDETIFALGGMALTSQAVGPKMLWLRNHEPEVYRHTRWYLTASSYLISRLTGEYVIDRHTGSHFNPFVDIHRLNWDLRFADNIVEQHQLPAMHWSTDVVGNVTTEAADETGLAPGTPVTAGTVDAAAEAVSIGVVRPGDLMLMYGTTMFYILVTDRPIPDSRVWCTGYVFPESYDIAGGMATTGAVTRWFRDQLGAQELDTERSTGTNAYEALSQGASRVPAGSDGLMCLPYFAGERTPIHDPSARGVFAGLTLSHTREHMYRAVLEGTAYGMRHNIDTLRDLGISPARIVAVGGGTMNPLWLQIASDVLGTAQELPHRTIGAAYGDAFLAGLATGIVPARSVLDATWATIATTIEPDSRTAAVYDEGYGIFRRLYPSMKDELHALAAMGRRTHRSA